MNELLDIVDYLLMTLSCYRFCRLWLQPKELMQISSSARRQTNCSFHAWIPLVAPSWENYIRLLSQHHHTSCFVQEIEARINIDAVSQTVLVSRCRRRWEQPLALHRRTGGTGLSSAGGRPLAIKSQLAVVLIRIFPRCCGWLSGNEHLAAALVHASCLQ